MAAKLSERLVPILKRSTPFEDSPSRFLVSRSSLELGNAQGQSLLHLKRLI